MAAVIKELIAQGFDRETVIQKVMQALQVVRSEAEHMYAIETGAIDGDLIQVDEDGDEDE